VNVNLPPFLLEKNNPTAIDGGQGRIRYAYLERGIAGISAMIRNFFFDPSCLSGRGWLQKTDARVKVVFLAFFIVLISIKTRIASELAITVTLAVMAAFSGVGIVRFYGRVLRYTLLFGLLVTFPAMFNVVTPGDMLLPVIELPRPHQWWLYYIPREIGITSQGLQAVCLLNLRILNSIAAASLIVQTTPFNDIVKALKVFKVPETLLLIVTLSHKYIFILARMIDDMFLARKSRLAGVADNGEARAWVAGRLGILFRRSRVRYEEIFRAMQSRGFRDEVKLSAFSRPDAPSLLFGCIVLTAGFVLLWI
jgi:cobalt/nickel transport system permease protein